MQDLHKHNVLSFTIHHL